jgi:CRP-like cAMP-binding protein
MAQSDDDTSHFARAAVGGAPAEHQLARRLGIAVTGEQAQIIPAEPPNVPEDRQSFGELLLFVLGQLYRLGRSFFVELEPGQLETFARLFSPIRLDAKSYWCREGDSASTFAIVLAGALAVQNDSDLEPVAYLLAGDTIGQKELCGQRSRGSAVRALVPALIAEINYEELTHFIEVPVSLRD